MPPFASFLVVMPWGRVGSNLVMDLIRQAAIKKKLNSEQFNSLATIDEQVSWFRTFYEIDSPMRTKKLIGSKQSVLSMRDISVIEALLAEHEIKVIRLRRDNCLKAAISQIRAEQYAEKMRRETGRAPWAIKRGEPKPEPGYLDPEIVLRRTGIMETCHVRMMDAFGALSLLDIEYEEINGAPEDVHRRVASFLGIPKYAAEVAFEKATPNDLRLAVTNFEDVESAVRSSPFAKYLHA